MARLVEYVNPNPYVVQINGPNKESIRVDKFAKVVLSDWFIDRYTPKFLRVVRILNDAGIQAPVPSIVHSSLPVRMLGKTKYREEKQKQNRKQSSIIKDPNSVRSGRKGGYVGPERRKIVGKALSHVSEIYTQAIQEISVAISNGTGIGILSYNRLDSLQRLINSIRKYTDLSQTTVFVSDDASEAPVREWLSQQHDIILVLNSERLGIAGNSNRLMRCLSRFKHKILLNDDVEILKNGWEHFYSGCMKPTGYRHFCYRQLGVYGATVNDEKESHIGGLTIRTIYDKPHGAVMAFDDTAFDKVGYFDESLEQYGMEHVDWSNRVALSGLQPSGFHDVIGSSGYFTIHKERSALLAKGHFLKENRVKYESMKNDKSRVYVEPTTKSVVPSVSIVVPIRDIGRTNSIKTVLNNLRSQKYPEIELVLVEQDYERKFNIDVVKPIKHIFVQSSTPTQDFNKSKAFNQGILQTKSNAIILHDADIIVQADYISRVVKILSDNDGCHIGSRVIYLNAASSDSLYQTNKLDKSYTAERAVGYFEGGSIAFKRSVFVRIGGFNEAYEGYGCFEPGNTVLTDKGYKEITTVTADDRLCTHEGRFLQAIPKNREYNGDVYDIKCETKSITGVTPEHPFLIVGRGIPNWVPACKLKKGNEIATNGDPESIVEITKRQYKGLVYNFEVTKDHSYIVNGLKVKNCEDCDFFERLRDNSKFYNQRNIDMFHLWHSRVPGWNEKHKTNKKLTDSINRTIKKSDYIIHLRNQLLSKYQEYKKWLV